MRRTGFTFEVHAEVEFTTQEIDLLIDCSRAHYDFACKKLSQAGGLLRGLANRVSLVGVEKAGCPLSYRDLDLLCKVVENPPERTEAWKKLEHELHDQRRAVAAKTDEIHERHPKDVAGIEWLRTTFPDRNAHWSPSGKNYVLFDKKGVPGLVPAAIVDARDERAIRKALGES